MTSRELVQEAHAITNGLTAKIGTTAHVRALTEQMVEDREQREADAEADANEIGLLRAQLAGMTAHAERLQRKLWIAEGKIPAVSLDPEPQGPDVDDDVRYMEGV